MKDHFRHWIVFAVAGWLLTVAGFAADDIAGMFESGNKLYEQGKFAEAASVYEKAIQSGPASAALYFNLGNARFKLGEIGRAVAAYRKAEQLAPRDPDVRANLQFIRNQISGPTLAGNRWELWLRKLTVNEWTLLASAVFWLYLILLMLVQLRPGWKSGIRSSIWGAAAAFVVLGICSLAALSIQSAATAIVTVQQAAMRNGPLDESPSALTVHDGAELSVLDEKDNWVQVSVGNRIGWIKRDQLLLTK